MEMPKPNQPTAKLSKRIKLSRRFWQFAVPIALVVIAGGWLAIRFTQTQSACVIGQPGKVYGQPPAVRHMYAGEALEYRLRPDGQFVPIDAAKTSKTATHEYGLRVSFDQSYVNPRFGSRITGTLELLEDGKPVAEPPKDAQGKLIFQDLSVPVYLYGALVGVPQELNSQKYKFNWWPSKMVSPANSGWAAMPVVDHRIVYPVTHIYAPGGLGKRSYSENGWTIDLSSGRAQFELNYFGLRYAPYLQVLFGALHSYTSDGRGITIGLGAQDISVAKTVCFADQVSLNIPAVTDNLTQQTKKDFYYDVNISPVRLSNNKTTRIKVEVTAKNATTNRVETNPFQRVEVNAVALGGVVAEPVRNLGGGASGMNNQATQPRVQFKSRGKFVLTDPATPAIEKQMLFQTAQSRDDYTRAISESTNTIFTDLVNGKATLYYDFNGADDSLNTPLTFIVQPANFAIKNVVWGKDMKPISASANRSQKNLTLPEKPAQFIGEVANPRLNTPDLPTAPEPDFLYRAWQTDEVRDLVYTVHPVPVGGAMSSWWNKALSRLITWQILVILFGGLMLAWQLQQQKNKNTTSYGQSK